MNPRHLLTPTVLWLTVLWMVPQGAAAAELDFRMGLLPIAKVRVEQGQSASPELMDELDIRLGDPVSVQFVLENTGTEPSEPTLHPDPRSSPVTVKVRGPDGAEAVLSDYIAFHNTTLSRGSPQPIIPGATHTCSTFLYHGDYEKPEDGGPVQLTYLFDSPGRYEISATCMIGNPYVKGGGQSLPTLKAGPVVVNVGEPIEGWEQLRQHDILYYAGTSDWPVIEQSSEEVETLVRNADRPWLTAWYMQLTAPPVEKEDEEQQPAEEALPPTTPDG